MRAPRLPLLQKLVSLIRNPSRIPRNTLFFCEFANHIFGPPQPVDLTHPLNIWTSLLRSRVSCSFPVGWCTYASFRIVFFFQVFTTVTFFQATLFFMFIPHFFSLYLFVWVVIFLCVTPFHLFHRRRLENFFPMPF